MKSYKTLIIALAAIVVVIGLYFLLVKVFPAESDTAEAEASETVSTTAETVYVINEDYETVTGYEMLYGDGSTFKVDVIPPVGEDSNSTFEVTPKSDKFNYDSSKLRSMLYTVSAISAKEIIAENADDLSLYGLDKPLFTLVIDFEGGREVKLYIGAETVVDGNYYCMTNESKTVYMVGPYLISLLERSELEYRDVTFFPTYTDDDIYTNINWFRLTQRDGTVIEIETDDTYRKAATDAPSSYYVMSQPVLASGNSDTIQSEILDVAAPVYAIGVVCDITDAQYAEYGFDNPAKLEMKDAEGNSFSLLIGSKCENQEYTYVMLEGTGMVMTAETSCFTWQDIDYTEFMIRTAWYYNIENVSTVDYYIGDTEHDTLTVAFTEETDDEGETKTVISKATLNGTEISDTNARRLYTRTLNFRVVSDIPEGTELGEPEIKLVITLLSGEKKTLELIPINDRQYAARVNGEAKFYVYLKNVTKLKENIASVLEGDELEMDLD